jgi:hypothetical protein
MKMFTKAKRSAISGLRKKVFTEINYLVICGNGSDFQAQITFLHHRYTKY